jgi:hypothetical protein
VVTELQLHILQHSLGLNQFGEGSHYRNRYISDPNADLDGLVRVGFLKDFGAIEAYDGMHYYEVTPAGKIAIQKESPKPPKISRSRRRYLAFLNADSGMPFG